MAITSAMDQGLIIPDIKSVTEICVCIFVGLLFVCVWGFFVLLYFVSVMFTIAANLPLLAYKTSAQSQP